MLAKQKVEEIALENCSIQLRNPSLSTTDFIIYKFSYSSAKDASAVGVDDQILLVRIFTLDSKSWGFSWKAWTPPQGFL